MNERECDQIEIERRVAGLQHAVDRMFELTDRDRIADLIATGRRRIEQQPSAATPAEPAD